MNYHDTKRVERLSSQKAITVSLVLAQQEMKPHLHHLIEFELEYIPPLKKQEVEIPL
jgi:hypothetical protein